MDRITFTLWLIVKHFVILFLKGAIKIHDYYYYYRVFFFVLFTIQIGFCQLGRTARLWQIWLPIQQVSVEKLSNYCEERAVGADGKMWKYFMERLLCDDWAASTMESWQNTCFLSGISVTLSFTIYHSIFMSGIRIKWEQIMWCYVMEVSGCRPYFYNQPDWVAQHANRLRSQETLQGNTSTSVGLLW